MSTKQEKIDTSAERVHENDKSIHEPWVGLTDDELEEYSKWFGGKNVVMAVEDKLKEKNT